MLFACKVGGPERVGTRLHAPNEVLLLVQRHITGAEAGRGHHPLAQPLTTEAATLQPCPISRRMSPLVVKFALSPMHAVLLLFVHLHRLKKPTAVSGSPLHCQSVLAPVGITKPGRVHMASLERVPHGHAITPWQCRELPEQAVCSAYMVSCMVCQRGCLVGGWRK